MPARRMGWVMERRVVRGVVRVGVGGDIACWEGGCRMGIAGGIEKWDGKGRGTVCWAGN